MQGYHLQTSVSGFALANDELVLQHIVEAYNKWIKKLLREHTRQVTLVYRQSILALG